MKDSQELPEPKLTEVWASRLFEVASHLFVSSLLLGGLNGPKNTGFYLGVLAFALRLAAPHSLIRDTIKSPLALPLLAMLGAGMWGSLCASDQATSWKSFFSRDNLGMAIVFALMAVHQRPNRAEIKRIFGVVLLIFGLRYAWQFAYMVRNPVWLSPQSFPYEVLWNVRVFGELLVLLCPWAWAMPAVFGNPRLRIVTGIWTAIVVAMLLPIGYRGAWVGFSLGAAVWLFGRRSWKPVLWAVAALALIAAILPFLPDNNLATRAISRGLDDNNRIEYVWKPTLEYIEKRPFTGYGFGQEIFVRTLHSDARADTQWIKEFLTDPHNNTLAMQFAAGVPGTLAYALLILTCLIAAAKQARTATTEQRRQANLALLAAWAATFVSLGQFDIVNWNYFGFLIVMGVVLQRQRDETEKPDPEQAVPSGRRVLFVIRDKLGDSLLAFAIVQQYLKLRPGDDLTVLMRKDYAELVASEGGFRLVRYRSGAQAMLWAALQRVLGSPYDAIVVLRGFGDRVRKLGTLVPARRRISFSGKLAPTFSEWPPAFESEDWSLVESFRAAAVLEPGLVMPQRLEFLRLRPPAAVQGERFVGVCPITDEERRDLSQASLDPLLDHIARTHPGMPIKVLVRDGAENLFDPGGRSGCELVNFRDLTHLRDLFASMVAYYGADTGLYHLAAAMGIPATVVFGPTQPGRVILPLQEAASVRLEALAESHCDVKSCRDPACIEQACANLVSGDTVVPLDRTPADCPLRRHPPEARRINRWHRYPVTAEASPAPQAR